MTRRAMTGRDRTRPDRTPPDGPRLDPTRRDLTRLDWTAHDETRGAPMKTKDKRTLIPETSADTEALAACLRTVPVQGTISYMLLSKQIGRDVQSEARHLLATARRILLREDQVVFGAVRDVGLKRLGDRELVLSGGAFLSHINRTAARGVRTLTCVQDFAQLPLTDQVKQNTALSLLAVFYEVSKAKGVRRIENAVTVMQKQLPFADTLKALLLTT